SSSARPSWRCGKCRSRSSERGAEMTRIRLNVLIRALATVICLALLQASARPAPAQGAWPERTVTVVLPFPAGGNTDTMARLLAEHLAVKFGKGFVID